MHRRRKRSYIPFLLNPETRSDVIPVHLHFRETIPQARQSISHRTYITFLILAIVLFFYFICVKMS
ncbi:hypothetical protein ACS0TY_023647 [Phlomoides rotata]